MNPGNVPPDLPNPGGGRQPADRFLET